MVGKNRGMYGFQPTSWVLITMAPRNNIIDGVIRNSQYTRSKYPRQLEKMSFDEILDITAAAFLNFIFLRKTKPKEPRARQENQEYVFEVLIALCRVLPYCSCSKLGVPKTALYQFDRDKNESFSRQIHENFGRRNIGWILCKLQLDGHYSSTMCPLVLTK